MTKGGAGGRIGNDRVQWVSLHVPAALIQVNWPRQSPSAEAKNILIKKEEEKTKHEKSNEEV